jgi:hypothetical protein
MWHARPRYLADHVAYFTSNRDVSPGRIKPSKRHTNQDMQSTDHVLVYLARPQTSRSYRSLISGSWRPQL